MPRRDSEILRRAGEQIAQVKARSKAFPTEQDAENILEVEQEQEKRIAALLGPEKLREYRLDQIKSTSFGDELVTIFSATDSELLAISDYSKAEAAEKPGNPDFAAHQAAYEQKLRDALGPDRFSNFMNFKDPVYREALGFANRFGF